MEGQIEQVKQRCYLLELPAEIRTYIFELAIRSDKTVVTFRSDDYQEDTLQEATQPSLTRANRQLRLETLPLFYSLNTFVLHTEGNKASDALGWAQGNEAYLPDLLRISFWQRFVTLTNDRSSSNGAICLTIERPKRSAEWRVCNEWSWVTVTRRPNGVSVDAGFLMGSLRRMLAESADVLDTAGGVYGFLTDLRLLYVKEKMS